MEEEKKYDIKCIDFLYIASMVLFGLSFSLTTGPLQRGDWVIDGAEGQGNFMFLTITIYALASLICYFIGIFRMKRYNQKPNIDDPKNKYPINHYYGFFNFLMIFPLDFGLLFMIMTNNIEGYGNLIEAIAYGAIGFTFLVFFIIRKIRKKEEQMGLMCFDLNSFIYFSYASLFLFLNVFKIQIGITWFILLFMLNVILVHFTVFYPVKAMVYSIEYKEYNPIKTVYLFIRRLIKKNVFFFVGLAFTLLLGATFYNGAFQGEAFNVVFYFIGFYYFGLAIVRFFTFLWESKIERNSKTLEEKYRSEYRIMFMNGFTTLALTGLMVVVLVYFYNNALSLETASWFIFIQGAFISYRVVLLILDLIQAIKRKAPYDMVSASNSLFFTLVLIFSFSLSFLLYFNFKGGIPIVAKINAFSIISLGVGISLAMLVAPILVHFKKIPLVIKQEEVTQTDS